MNQQLLKAVEALVEYAIERHRSGDLAGAQALYGKALDVLPSHPVALHNLGLIILAQGDMASGELLLREAVRHRPQEASFLYSHALALQQQGKWHDALKQYNEAIRIRPAYREALENKGVVLQDLERYEEAIASYLEAINISPESLIANRNLGNALRVIGRIDDALEHYQNVLSHYPMNAEIRFGYGATLITKGKYIDGWPLYEWRFWSPDFLEKNAPYRVPLPHWNGSDLAELSLLVYGEQGIGDEIMFASCLADLGKVAPRLTLICQSRLVGLFSRSFPNIKVLARVGEHPPHEAVEDWMADACIAIGSLPSHFRISEQSFPGTAYLLPDMHSVRQWKDRLSSLGHGLKVGLSWRGGAETRAKNARSIALERFTPLFKRKDVTFINIQYGQHTSEIEAFNEILQNPLHSFQEIDPLSDMDSFSALISALDLVITVDNSTAHLAGALGIPTWLMLPAHADWRWHKGHEITPWYNSLKIFWQSEHLNSAWDEVIDRVDRSFDDFTSTRKTAHPLEMSKDSAKPYSPMVSAGKKRPIALFLNDTSYWYHWGCTATSLAIHEELRAQGYWVDSVAITEFNRLKPLPSTVEDFDRNDFFVRFTKDNQKLTNQILQAEVVIINGEGTLHGLGQAPLAILYVAFLAKHWLGKITHIINHSCYPGNTDIAEAIYRKVYSVMDFVAIRENHSAIELSRLGIHTTESFDCLPLYLARHGPAWMPFSQDRKRVVMSGSVKMTQEMLQIMVELAKLVTNLGYELQILVGANAYLASDDNLFVNALNSRLQGNYTLVTAHAESAWFNCISGAALLISGRFHHTIAAACLGTPIAVTASNTNKIQGLLDRLSLNVNSVWLNVDTSLEAKEKVTDLLDNPEASLITPGTLKHIQMLAALNFAHLKFAEAPIDL